jgi:hypothetical protein
MQANGTSTWPFVRDPQFNYVTMLLHGDGSAGANNGSGAAVTPTVTSFNADASTNNFNVTINGDARSNNFNPYQSGYYSNYFDGTSGQYLNAPANTVFNFGTGDFTVEAWVYPTSTSGTRPIIEVRTTGGANGFALLSQSGATTLNVFTNSAFVGASTNSLTLNAWNYVALTRSGNTWTYWINGVSGGSFTNSSTQSDGGTTGPKIGGSTTAGEIWIGYISNARITKGAALYTTTFTPSTIPLTTTVSSGTVSLLTSQSNRFIDNSVNAFTITVNGTPQVSPAQPFTLPSSVATYGSGYFDGTGDFLSVSANSALNQSGDLTIEGWVNLSATPSVIVPIYGFENVNFLKVGFNSSRQVTVDQSQVGTKVTGTTAVPLGTWNHIALVRSGSSSNNCKVYLNGVQEGQFTDTSTSTVSGTGYIFRRSDNTTTVAGYLSDLRVTNTAVYASAFTPPTAPLTAISGTSLLTTQYNGGGNNSGFKDSSQNNFVITRNGNTTQGSFSPYGSNWSNYFDGTSDTLTYTGGSSLNFGTGDFTIELWAYLANTGTFCPFLRPDDSGAFPEFGYNFSTGQLQFDARNAAIVAVTTTMPTNQWTHVAVSRSGTSLRLFINGTQVGSTTTNSTNFGSTTGTIRIAGSSFSATHNVNGYLSNFRVLKGTALYTTTFTPSTTPLTAITNTSLLTCADNRFIDDSTNNFTVTANGNTSVQRFSPFANATAYNPAVTGGSGYFGSANYLSAASNVAFGFGTGDFTVEAWVYPNAAYTTYNYIWATGVTDGLVVYVLGGVLYARTYNGIDLLASSVAPALNAWSHVAVTRNGTTLRIFVNGVQTGTTTNSTNFATGSGLIGNDGTNVAPWYGYISDVRVVKGTAVYTANFTPPTAPLTPIARTSLLLSTTNAGILDQSMMVNLETVGNAAITTSVVKYGTGSMYFDGTGDYLKGQSQSIGSGDLTIECWVYLNVATGDQHFVQVDGASDSNVVLSLDSTANKFRFLVRNDSTTNNTDLKSSISPSANTWYHIAGVVSGSSSYLFVNGSTTSGATGSLSGTRSGTGTNAYLGINGSGGTRPLNGYLDDVRITKGYARYTANFTPPTQALPNG